MIYVVATLTVKPEMRAELIEAARACIAETRKEAGNIAYDLHESVSDPTRMVFVEQWETAEAPVRWKMIPVPASAGLNVAVTSAPEWTPMPRIVKGFSNVVSKPRRPKVIVPRYSGCPFESSARAAPDTHIKYAARQQIQMGSQFPKWTHRENIAAPPANQINVPFGL